MTKDQAKKLPHGLYRLYWKRSYGGGSSLAAVGSTETGRRWFAPTNWVLSGPSIIGTTGLWKWVASAELIDPDEAAQKGREAEGEREARIKLEVAYRKQDAAMSVLFERLNKAGVDCSDLIS